MIVLKFLKVFIQSASNVNYFSSVEVSVLVLRITLKKFVLVFDCYLLEISDKLSS